MKEGEALKEALKKLSPAHLKGTALRLVDQAYAEPHLVISGEGAKRHGGRFNPPVSFKVVYLTEDARVGLDEITYPLSLGGRFELPGARRVVVVPVDFALARVIDLCQYRVRIALGTDLEEILLPLEPYEARGELAPTQILGTTAFELGYTAIKYPSRHHPKTCNLAVFPENLKRGEFLRPRP